MPVRYQMTLSGLDAYLEAFNALGGNVDQAAAKALEAAGDLILAEMESRVPVGRAPQDPHPGNLKAHLKRQPVEISGHFISVTVGVDPNVDKDTAIYGNVQEYGSKHDAAQPYIRPAFDESKAKVRAIEKQVLQAEGVPIP
jgi:HK97 gp10 family phage protein